MDLKYFQCIWNRYVLLILTVYYGKSNALNVSDITPMCLYYFKFDSRELPYESMKPPGDFCKSVATYSKFGVYPPRDDLDVEKFKQKLPYVYIYDRYPYRDMKNRIRPLNVQSYIDNINKIISNNEVDVLVFEFFNDIRLNARDFDENFQEDLVSMVGKLRENRKEMLIGCKLDKNPLIVSSVLDFNITDGAFNFYVISSSWYDNCIYHKDKDEMVKPPSPEQMQKTIDGLKKIGYVPEKLFLTVNIYVKTFKEFLDYYPEIWSYAWICKAKPGRKRRYCRGSLKNIYAQSKVVFDNKLAGVVVEATDCDDFQDNCGCGPWPATQCVCDGIHGHPIKDNLGSCKNFGKLPKER